MSREQGTVDEEGRWLDKSELVAFGEDGKQLPEIPSSFDSPMVELELFGS